MGQYDVHDPQARALRAVKAWAPPQVPAAPKAMKVCAPPRAPVAPKAIKA